MNGIHSLPLPILSDSYKASHFKTYPEAIEMKAVRIQSYLKLLDFKILFNVSPSASFKPSTSP